MAHFRIIATHPDTNPDEMFAAWMLQEFGERFFPGVSGASLEFWGEMPKDKTWKDLEDEGVLCVGIGGGRFDEHPSAEGLRKEDECAATLVAKELELDEAPELKPLLKFVKRRDLSLCGSAFDLHSIPKTMHDAGCDYEVIWLWVFQAFEAIYKVGLEQFVQQAGADFKKAKISVVPTAGGEAVKLVVGHSDSPQFAKYARSPHGCRAGIVVQRKSTGNVMIQTDQRRRLNLDDLAQMIRVEENVAQGKPIPRSADRAYLRSEGTLPECPEWHYFTKGQMLLNGSKTHCVSPTHLRPDRIAELVKIGLDPAAFEPSREKDCRAGQCNSSPRNPCPWYRWHLRRCRQNRFEAARTEALKRNVEVS